MTDFSPISVSIFSERAMKTFSRDFSHENRYSGTAVTLKKPRLFHADFNHDFNHEFLHSGTSLADFSQDFNHVEHPFYTLNNKKHYY